MEQKEDVEEGSIRRDSGVDFSDDANGGLSHEDDEEQQQQQQDSGSEHKKSQKKKNRKGDKNGNRKREVEFKSGMIFNLEM